MFVVGGPNTDPFVVPSDAGVYELPMIEVARSHTITGVLLGANDKPLPNVQLVAVDGSRRYGIGKSNRSGKFQVRAPDGIETRIELFNNAERQEPLEVIQPNPLVVRYAPTLPKRKWKPNEISRPT